MPVGLFFHSSSALLKAAFIVLLILSSTSYAKDYVATFTRPLPPNQSVVFENTNLTAKDFFNALMSGSIEERRYSELYLLGVLDATEGSTWCDYRKYKTITIDERLFVNLKKLTKQELDARAATVIKNILSKEFPCESSK